MDRFQFSRQLADAARAMAQQSNTADTLQEVVEMATSMVGACDLAGVSIIGKDGVTTTAASHSSVRLIDELQFQLSEGPAVQELRTSEVVEITDLATDAPWPRWAPEVVRQVGVRSFLGFRLFADRSHIGALNLYATEPDAFDEDDRLDGLVLAVHASLAIDAHIRHEQMHTALRSRQLIGEATGILRERYGLTSEQAFGVLKRISSHQNMKLFAVAQHVLENDALPGGS